MCSVALLIALIQVHMCICRTLIVATAEKIETNFYLLKLLQVRVLNSYVVLVMPSFVCEAI